MSIFRPFTIRRIHLVLLGMLLILVAASSVAQVSSVAQASTIAQTTTPKIVPGYATGQDFGGTFSAPKTVSVGQGFRTCNVQLTGWSLSYTSGDHHIKTAKVRISDVKPDCSNGSVTFMVSGDYSDVNGDDDYIWLVYYTILALP